MRRATLLERGSPPDDTSTSIVPVRLAHRGLELPELATLPEVEEDLS